MNIKYFIVKYINQTINGEEVMFECRVVDNNYKEIFRESLNKEDKEAFVKIMCSNLDALLYRNHEKLKPLAYLKIDNHTNNNILDGAIWP